MKETMKLTYVFALALVLSIFSCNNDDEETVIPEIIVEINVQNLTVTIDENPANGQSLGMVETDGDGALNFSITSQTPTGSLTVNTSTGEVTVADATMFDFETNPEITATVSVIGAANTSTVTINLNDLDEISAQDLTVAIDENPIDGQVVGSIQVDGGGTLSFSIISQTPAGALSIDAGTGELTVVAPNLFDFETNPILTADISVDNSINTEMVIATINLVDLDEVSAQNLTASIDENPTAGDVVGSIQATGGNLAFAITFQNPAGALEINPSTGELTVADDALFDFETNPNMLATISVENSVNMVSVNASINLNDMAEIGEYRDGGVVFWLDGNGGGLVCDINDLNGGASIAWWNGSGSNTGTLATAIGTGQANTTGIINSQGAGTYAATLCDNLSLNGFSDWYLPSKDELDEMFANKSAINATAAANGGSDFITLFYWSSTEDANVNLAWIQYFSTGNHGLNAKGNLAYVRAIRTFEPNF